MNPLGFLPFLAFLAWFLALIQYDRDQGRSFIRSLLGWGTYAVLTTEVLSLFQAVSTASLGITWGLPTVGAVLLILKAARRGRLELPRIPIPHSPFLRVVAGGVVACVVLTGVVAWLAPPNTWDALTYHMSRVAQWAQNGTIGHYATGIDAQDFMPPGASVLALQMYVLGQGDRLANFVQWFAMVGCLVVAPRIASRLGAGETGQWVTAAFVATLPSGIMQATSVTTDYVVALWVAIAALSVVEIWQGRRQAEALLSLGAAIGLSVVTKQTAVAYLAPFLLILPLVVLLRRNRPRFLLWAALGLLLAALLNAGPLGRNLSTYGSLSGPASRVESQTNQILDARVLLSNVLRNLSLHAGTPSPHVNKAITLMILWVHDQIRLDVSDRRITSEGVFRVRSTSLHETAAGNPVHALLLVALIPLGWLARGHIHRKVWLYAGLVVLTFVVLSAMLQWKPTGARYHLPFFVLVAPVAGVVLEAFPSAAVWRVAVGALLVSCVPWLLGNHSRPILSGWPGADVDSVLVVPRDELLFANAPYLVRPYQEITELIRREGCRQVGVALPGQGLEYPFWALLGAPSGDLVIDWLVAGTPSARYVDPSFTPCAVICEKCPPEWERVRGLPELYRYGPFRLFLDRQPE
jgi:hypothetical protein